MSADEDRLRRLADTHGVATQYEDQGRQTVTVPVDAVRAVLTALGVDPDGPPSADGEHPFGLPGTVVVTAGAGAPQGLTGDVSVTLEDGTGRTVAADDLGGLPLGWHRLDADGRSVTLVVVPATAPQPPEAWGWMLQLYALRSKDSWGIGDLADLAGLAERSAREHGAGFVLVNPLHAAAPVTPMQPSPYYPTSRRFTNPVYLRIEQVPEYAAAEEELRGRIDGIGQRLRAALPADRIDRDAVWAAKLAALEALWPTARQDALAAFRDRTPGLDAFALFCALAERHGVPWQDWPQHLRDPGGPGAADAAAELAERVAFFGWLQLLCEEQLAAAERAATDAGMAVGIVHDLAVGVDPGGADAWALQDVLATGATVGAPPDSFNQRGQDWGLPPWHPDRLVDTGYRPYRELAASVLGRGGGVRIDHILGLFRLWWIPRGSGADLGSFVRYDDEALIGVLALEAERAGAVLVGEDLGTVEPRVQQVLARRSVLGCTVLWFERDEDSGDLLPPQDWRPGTLATLSTHDLPTAAGWLAGEHVRVRDELGQLTRPVEEERAQADEQRTELLGMLADLGLDTDDPVLGMHQLLARTPCRLLAAAPGDVLGDVRQPNLPGTVEEYPNWRLPVADGDGRPVTLEEFLADERVRAVARVLSAARPGRPLPSQS